MYSNDMWNASPQVTTGMGVWGIVSVVLAIVGGILVMTLFLTKGNKTKFKGFVKWLYDFLNFDILAIDIFLRGLYATISIFIFLSSFQLISISFVAFLLYLVIGLVVVRLTFEMFLMVIKICNNTTEINEKLKK